MFETFLGCGFDAGWLGSWSGTCSGITLNTPSYDMFSEYAPFDGSSSNVDLGTVDFDPNGIGFTIAAWVRVGTGCTSFCTIVANTSSSATIDGFRFYYDYNGGAGKLVFKSTSSSTSTDAESTTGLIAADSTTWHHVAVVTDPANSYAYLYIDGFYQGQVSAARPNFPTNTQAYVGQMDDTTNKFFGDMDDLSVFEYPLSDAEITAIAYGF